MPLLIWQGTSVHLVVQVGSGEGTTHYLHLIDESPIAAMSVVCVKSLPRITGRYCG